MSYVTPCDASRFRVTHRAAHSYMSMTMYDDLAKRKQIVLLRGDFSHHLSKEVRTAACADAVC